MAKQNNRYYAFSHFRIDVSERVLLRESESVVLTQKAFDTLLVLVQNSGRVVEKDELLRKVWPDTFVEETTLAQNIFTLRKALGETPNKNRYIETVPRRGYRFVARVSEYGSENVAGHTASTEQQGALKSLAVLPFDSISHHDDDQCLGLGMADALITRLSNVRKIIVRPTSAVLKYNKREQPWSAGNELKVDFVLEGRILRSGDKIRVTAQLVSIETGAPLWADKFDEDFVDIFTVQDKISERLIDALTIQLTSNERKLLAKYQTTSSEAYQHYLKGRYLWNQWTEESFLKSIECFRKVIEIDRSYAPAYAGLSDAYSGLAYHGYLSPLDAIPQSRAAAEQALRIDDTLAEAHFSFASTLFFYDWEWAAAESEFCRAIELNPACAEAFQGYGLFLTAMGRFDEALKALQHALDLDPVSLLINTSLGFPYYYSGRYDEALAQWQQVLDVNKEFGLAHLVIGNAYVAKEMYDAAIAEYNKATVLLGSSPDVLSSLGYAYALLGNRQAANRTIDKLKKLGRRYVLQIGFAIIYTGLGDKDRAFEWLERSYELRCNKLVYLNVHPFFDSLRSDRRFSDLLNRIGFKQ